MLQVAQWGLMAVDGIAVGRKTALLNEKKEAVPPAFEEIR